MLTLVTSRTESLKDVLRESFAESLDGYWYPTLPGAPLVRVQIGGGAYSIERRLSERSSWLPIVTAHVGEFDPMTFRLWRERWPLVA